MSTLTAWTCDRCGCAAKGAHVRLGQDPRSLFNHQIGESRRWDLCVGCLATFKEWIRNRPDGPEDMTAESAARFLAGISATGKAQGWTGTVAPWQQILTSPRAAIAAYECASAAIAAFPAGKDREEAAVMVAQSARALRIGSTPCEATT